ncbi:Crp/Fnr family transcriptional regulator [Cyclobacterium plantarum]|nr:Crp/Fnr family transcriptional regulator [Cyclobacterium plantarum]
MMVYPSTITDIYAHPGISDADLESIFRAHVKVFFYKGDLILTEGQFSNAYYCLEKGLVRAFARNIDGKDITTGFFSKNEIVIEVASLFLRQPTRENIQALSDCECWMIGYEAFQELFEKIEGFTEWGRTWMSRALLANKQRSLSMITDSATNRYLSLRREQPEVLQVAPLKHIASYLGVTDSSLSRIRKEVAQMGR